MSTEPDRTRADLNLIDAIAWHIAMNKHLPATEIARNARAHIADIDAQEPDAFEEYRFWAGVENAALAYVEDGGDPAFDLDPDGLDTIGSYADRAVSQLFDALLDQPTTDARRETQ